MKDKVVMIVGATGGIGKALTEKLAASGSKLILVAQDRDRLNQLSSETLSEHIIIPTDITDPSQVEALMTKAIAEFGRVDALVNAAGAGILKQFNKIEPSDLDKMLDLNLKGSFYTCQAAINVMKEKKFGHICNVVGILGKHSMAMGAAYCASKFGVVGFSKCMADEVKRYGIKFTLFYLGGVDSPFWDNAGLKVDRSKMLSTDTAANAIVYALNSDPQTVPMEINIQPESHLFF
jgi:short-subunit dehydrogenase